MADLWITVLGWEKFQHYGNRRPVWIKLYLELRDSDNWRSLTLAEQGLLVNIWIHYEPAKYQLSVSGLHTKITATFRQKQIERLVDAGFIALSASKPLASRYHRASAEKEEEKDLTKAVTSTEYADNGQGFQIPANLLKEMP